MQQVSSKRQMRLWLHLPLEAPLGQLKIFRSEFDPRERATISAGWGVGLMTIKLEQPPEHDVWRQGRRTAEHPSKDLRRKHAFAPRLASDDNILRPVRQRGIRMITLEPDNVAGVKCCVRSADKRGPEFPGGRGVRAEAWRVSWVPSIQEKSRHVARCSTAKWNGQIETGRARPSSPARPGIWRPLRRLGFIHRRRKAPSAVSLGGCRSGQHALACSVEAVPIDRAFDGRPGSERTPYARITSEPEEQYSCIVSTASSGYPGQPRGRAHGSPPC